MQRDLIVLISHLHLYGKQQDNDILFFNILDLQYPLNIQRLFGLYFYQWKVCETT